jgi:glycosyltransferase involved in cell wall biosynthesis
MDPVPEIPPVVSVVIPTYKHARYIDETLRSVFAQTFTDFEVIVVNDGSPDDTAAVLQPWIASGHIRYREQTNAGQSAARNTGIRLARGEFLALLDDDDLWPEDKLAVQVERLRDHPEFVVTYGYVRGFGTQEFRDPRTPGDAGDLKDVLLRRNIITSPGQALIRTSGMRAIGGLDETIRGADDWDLWISLSHHGTFDYTEHCTLRYRLHENNASRNSRYMFDALIRVLHKHLGPTPFSSRWREWFECRRFVGRLTGTPEMDRARAARRDGKMGKVVGHLWRAARYDPPLVGSPRLWKILFKG